MTTVEETIEFDPIEELAKLGVVGLPEEIELPSDVEPQDERIHTYGAGITLPEEGEGYLPATLNACGATPRTTVGLCDSVDIYAAERAEQGGKTTAMRFNAGKLRWDLLPPEIEGVVEVYTMGAAKYADRNWEKGLSLTQCFASLMRHAWKWMRGEDVDDESGLHHMDHVAWNAIAISTFFKRGRKDLDDRP